MKEKTKWEYILETDLSEVEMDKMGQDGWELVSVVQVITHIGQHIRLYFKRPIL